MTPLAIALKRGLLAALGGSVALLALGAHAADPVAGERKAQACMGCHGPAGRSADPAYPVLAGQPAQALSIALYEFREGKRRNALMTPMAEPLSNADMADLAAYFSAQTAPAPLRQTSDQVSAAGQLLARKYACVACHGANLAGQQQMPRLAGQHRDYLRAQLIALKNGSREDLDGTMSSAAQGLSAEDIEVLADYLSALAVTAASPPR